MRIAIIDAGTNTFHLLIIEKNGSDFTEIFKNKESVKLGQSGIVDKTITPEAFERGIATFKKFKAACVEHGADKIIALGTAALRNAANSSAFTEKVKQETGIELIVISGEIEAELICNGVRHSMEMGNDKSLILDIGGGSVEGIIANNTEIFWKQSFDTGGALLLDKFKPADPVNADDVQRIENFIGDELKTLFQACDLNRPVQLIGSSGSFDTFSELMAYRFSDISTLQGKTYVEYDMEQLKSLHDQLLASTHSERLAMKGMPDFRVDVIVLASILVQLVLKKTGIKKTLASTYAMKEGILYKILS